MYKIHLQKVATKFDCKNSSRSLREEAEASWMTRPIPCHMMGKIPQPWQLREPLLAVKNKLFDSRAENNKNADEILI
jgi:hypothetical protein